jgi:hypothetical protein
LALTAICVAVGGASAQASEPTMVLEPNCSTSDGKQNYDVRAGAAGFPPGTDFWADLEFQTIEADGSLKPSFGTYGTFTTEADGSFVRAIGVGQPAVATLTVNSDLLPGGSQSNSVRVTCEPEPPTGPPQTAAKARPKLVAQCGRGGYRRYGFKSRRRCVAYVRRGPRAR